MRGFIWTPTSVKFSEIPTSMKWNRFINVSKSLKRLVSSTKKHMVLTGSFCSLKAATATSPYPSWSMPTSSREFNLAIQCHIAKPRLILRLKSRLRRGGKDGCVHSLNQQRILCLTLHLMTSIPNKMKICTTFFRGGRGSKQLQYKVNYAAN